jgi:hypothetical protein
MNRDAQEATFKIEVYRFKQQHSVMQQQYQQQLRREQLAANDGTHKHMQSNSNPQTGAKVTSGR